LNDSNASLRVALEQQTATAEVLRVIASSPTDLQTVLDTIAEAAAKLCGADDALVGRVVDGAQVQMSAWGSISRRPRETRFPLDRGHIPGRAILDGVPVSAVGEPDQISDEFPIAAELFREHGVRAALSVPLLRAGAVVGVITIRRVEALPFSTKQVTLLETFADQAVIAIENARLFEELGQRNLALNEALEHQTATAEVLGIIASSPTDAGQVLNAIVQSLTRLSGSPDGILAIREEADIRVVADVATFEHAVPRGGRVPIAMNRPSTRALLECRTIHIPDQSDPVWQSQFPGSEFRTTGASLTVPLVREGEGIGIIQLRRLDPQPYSQHEITLAETLIESPEVCK
jgi:GAF domain-containing protein